MKRILFLALTLLAVNLQASLIIYNVTNKHYASLKMLSGPYRGQCLSNILIQGGAWSESGYPSRPINDMELKAVCGGFPCAYGVFVGTSPTCTGSYVGSFDMTDYYHLRVRSQTVPHFGLEASDGLITVYNY